MISLAFYLYFITLAPASTAQVRIWHDDEIRSHYDPPLVTVTNMPFLYQLSPQDTLSTKQLRPALELVVVKHLSLRTALILDKEENRLMQRIMHVNDNHKQLFSFVESIYETDEHLMDIMHNEKHNSHLFDLAQGLVCRCHLVYYKQISFNSYLCDQDADHFQLSSCSVRFFIARCVSS